MELSFSNYLLHSNFKNTTYDLRHRSSQSFIPDCLLSIKHPSFPSPIDEKWLWNKVVAGETENYYQKIHHMNFLYSYYLLRIWRFHIFLPLRNFLRLLILRWCTTLGWLQNLLPCPSSKRTKIIFYKTEYVSISQITRKILTVGICLLIGTFPILKISVDICVSKFLKTRL